MSIQAQSILEYQQLAQQHLEPALWRYLNDGDNAADAQALAQCAVMTRPLRDLRGGHTRLSLFGQVLKHPLILAPVAYQRLFHPHGESASAMACAAQGSTCVISSLSSQPIGEVVQAALAGSEPSNVSPVKPWFQLYWQGSREHTLQLSRKALDAGCSAIVFTVDAPVKQANLVLPPHVRAVNLEPDPLLAGALENAVFDGWMAQAPIWDDLRWLRRQTDLPLLVKGILHPDDAAAAMDVGCDGIVVSNHGGRVMQGGPQSLRALKTIVQRIDARIPVLFDSGVRSGRDAFVALAHGANAVLVGRPFVWGLAVNGAVGVAHVMRLLRDELEMTMALAGCASLKDIGLSSLVDSI